MTKLKLMANNDNPLTTAPVFKPPGTIPPKLHAFYSDICNHLHLTKRFHHTDARLVEEYILTLLEAAECRKICREEGMVLNKPGGGLQPHPAFTMGNQAKSTAVKIATALGLAPTARQRISMSIVEGAEDDGSTGWLSAGRK